MRFDSAKLAEMQVEWGNVYMLKQRGQLAPPPQERVQRA
jgi:hypothetical protein